MSNLHPDTHAAGLPFSRVLLGVIVRCALRQHTLHLINLPIPNPQFPIS
ncbi:MAG: hypothetical protein AAF316_15810 [Cyanobacteria bacterium P01_A01_bin.80]